MRFLVALILIIAVTTASRSNRRGRTRPPNRARNPAVPAPENKRKHKELVKDHKEKLLVNCQKKRNRCKGQTDEYKKKRETVKAFLVENLKTHANLTEHEASTRAEMRLNKIHNLKKKMHAKRGLADIEPADTGLWEQDIVLTDAQIDAIHESLDNPRQIAVSPEDVARQKRAAAIFFEKKPGYFWKLPVNYWVSDTFSSTEKAIIDSALGTITQATGCISFAKDSSRLTTGSQIQYVKVGSTGCYGNSMVGHVGIQAVNLAAASWCTGEFLKGMVLHETIHALGGGHEQSRMDRDAYIDILWSNIDPQEWSQYGVDTWSTSYGVPYNYQSVMHYEQGTFAVSTGLDTMHPRVSTQLHSNSLTGTDVLQLKRMYCGPSTCVDAHQDCGYWAINGYCANAQWSAFTKQKCSRSCGLC